LHEILARSILSGKNTFNVYRGCTHGCIYCDSRSDCYGFDHDFEDIACKQNAPDLLKDALARRKKKCMLFSGSMCDPYMPLEKECKLTRKCLQVVLEAGFGLTLLTKSCLALRDMDLFAEINRRAKFVFQMTATTYDAGLCRIVEPYTDGTAARLEALRRVHDAGIPTIAWMTPILPFINDTPENISALTDALIQAGVKGIFCPDMGVTLRDGNREYFYQKLDAHFPGFKKRYAAAFGRSYMCVSPRNDELMAIFREKCRRSGVMHDADEIWAYLGRLDDAPAQQLSMF